MERNSSNNNKTNTMKVANNSQTLINTINTISNNSNNSNAINNNCPLITTNASNMNAINANNNAFHFNSSKYINNINKSHVIKEKSEMNAKQLNYNKTVVNSHPNHKSAKSATHLPNPKHGSAQAQPLATTISTDTNSANPALPLIDRTPCGSAELSPHLDESYDTPPYLRWGQDFHCLLNDEDGRQLFMSYLKNEGLEHLLEFWFACEGLKSNESEDKERIRKLVKIIYKFIRNSRTIELSDKVRQTLKQDLTTDSDNERKYDKNVFDAAQQEVEDQLKSSIYTNFLRSDIYLNCYSNAFNNQCLGAVGGYESPKESVQSADGSVLSVDSSLEDYNPRNQYYDILPTLHEDSELQTTNALNNTSDANLTDRSHAYPLNRFQSYPVDDCHINLMSSGSSDTLMQGLNRILTQRSATSAGRAARLATESHPLSPNQSRVSPAYQSYYRSKSMANPPNPYHVKYSTVQPTSAQDSELQSMSSHSTNDSISCVSGQNGSDSRLRTSKHMIRHNAKLNTNSNHMNAKRDLIQDFQSRTQKPLPPSANYASIPDKFAPILIEKLEELKREQEKHENNDKKLNEVLQALDPKSNANTTSRQSTSNPIDVSTCRPNNRVKEVLCKQKFEFVSPDDNDQSILDKHFAQVFPETPNETPTDSIGRCASPPKQAYRPYYNPNPKPTPEVVVTLKYSTESIPYRLSMSGCPPITLRRFKQQISAKRGNWQYYFKRKCDDKELIDIAATYVLEKITDDNALLPLIDGKIFAELQESN